MHIYNRELSWLAFNERVLQEAQDKTVPLLQRLRFLGIFSNNQDEFIKVRVANLIRMNRFKTVKSPKTVEGFSSRVILEKVYQAIDSCQLQFDRTYRGILAEMRKKGICIKNEKQLTKEQALFCRKYFSEEVSQWLVPLMLRKSTRIPFLSDNQIYHAVRMESGSGSAVRYAIISIPVNRTCPRFVKLPSKKGKTDIIFIDDIIRLCLDEIFFMFSYTSITAHTFKIIRDAWLTVDEDISKSLVEKMEEGLDERMHGEPVRLAYDREMPDDLLDMITTKLRLKKADRSGGGRYHMMKHLTKFPVIDPALEYETLAPMPHPDIRHFSSILSVVREKDILLNYPYHTFNHVIDFLREAAIDPKVTRICITLYRTAERSKIINALLNANQNGKEVVVLEELMARFDEEQNIENSDLLQKTGITVIHGFKALKVHSKLILIERKEKGHTKGYAYIGTGNFNEDTAKIYGDFGLFTSCQEVTTDARAVFDFLLNTHKHYRYRKLIVSPYYMRNRFEKLIEREIKNSQKGKNAYIYAKCNSLTDIRMIRLLYKASQAGVKIKLIIRGACCLRPRIPGVSENIEVISIVDKYLEHARLYIFHNDGEDLTIIGSADWMARNLDNRVEVAAPVADQQIRKTLMDVFRMQWSDNIKARELALPGENGYMFRQVESEPFRSQFALYDYYQSKLKAQDEI